MIEFHNSILRRMIAEEDWEGAAMQRDALFETVYCAKRAQIGERMALQSMALEAGLFERSGLSWKDWMLVRRRRIVEAGSIPYELIRFRSPFRSAT